MPLAPAFLNPWRKKKKKKEEAKAKNHQSRQTCAIWNHKEVSKPHEVLYSFWAGLPGQNYSVTCNYKVLCNYRRFHILDILDLWYRGDWPESLWPFLILGFWLLSQLEILAEHFSLDFYVSLHQVNSQDYPKLICMTKSLVQMLLEL